MTTETLVCAQCETEEDVNAPGEPCARCNCEATKIKICTCYVFDFIKKGRRAFIGYRCVSHNPNCKVHG
jgi:hypothetical protein